MNKFTVTAIVLIVLAGVLALIAFAAPDPTWISDNAIWNRVFDSTTNTISIQGV